LSSGSIPRQLAGELQLAELVDALERYWSAKTDLDSFRRARCPWVLRPAAWTARGRRAQAERRLRRQKEHCLSTLGPSPA